MNFNKLPKQLVFQELVDLAGIVIAFDVLSLVRPWLIGWTDPWKPFLLQAGYEQWLYVAWAFGYEKEFDALGRHLVKTTTVDEEDVSVPLLIGSNGARLNVKEIRMPPGVIGKSTRLQPIHTSSLINS
jgi:hypothetical protein